MKSVTITRFAVFLLVISINIGCDQVSKHIVREKISSNTQIGYLNNHLLITKIENTGAFLSLGDSLSKPVKNILLTILPFFALTFGFFYLLLKRNILPITNVGFCFILGGAIGNIFDRLIYGSVTDFLYIDLNLFHTGIFNMADVSIVTGALLILIGSLNHKFPVNKPMK